MAITKLLLVAPKLVVADWLGWSALSPDAQFGAICGAAGGLGLSMTLRSLFGGLELRRKPKAKRRKGQAKPKAKAKPRKGRR
jgi:hypothetical protein